VILHEHDIRKRKGAFARLNKEAQEVFLDRLTGIIAATEMTMIAVVIDKVRHKAKYSQPEHPYHLAMQFGLERVAHFLALRGQGEAETTVICEARGAKEDAELELEFRRVCDGANRSRRPYAALTLTAALLAILNATSPLWGTLIAALRGGAPLTGRTLLGLALGVAGVGLLVGFDRVALQPGAGTAIAAALGAAPGPGIAVAVLALGVVCSGVAYLLYFRLIGDIGAAPALTVTFLIPLFGVFWGWLFLGETVGWHTLAGGAVVIAGTALVTGFSPAMLRVRAHA
jgi:uncharacterized membrane protein